MSMKLRSETSSTNIKRWGYHIFSALQSAVLPRSAFHAALRARLQLERIVGDSVPDAKIYLEGSAVTTGILEKNSDLDMCCIVASNGSIPDSKAAGKLSEKIYSKIKYSIPSQSRIQHIHMVRIPLIKYEANALPQVTESIHINLTGERARNARTAYFNFPFALNPKKESDLKALLQRTGSNIEEIKHENRGNSAVCTFRTATTDDTLRCLGILPDGKSGIISRATRHSYTRGTPSPLDVPEILRFSFDLTFLGYAVRNSYLIRQYLHDPNGPNVSRVCQMAIKRWGKTTGFGVGAKGNLTSYGMTILWIYFLLRTEQIGWFDPWKIPDALFLPKYPNYAPFEGNMDYEAIARQLKEFFTFYSTFDFHNEVISLSRPRSSTRTDVRWNYLKKEKFHFNMCIEDPYEDDLNCARRIDARKLEWFKETCRKAIQVMEGSPDSNLKDLLGVCN